MSPRTCSIKLIYAQLGPLENSSRRHLRHNYSMYICILQYRIMLLCLFIRGNDIFFDYVGFSQALRREILVVYARVD